MALVVLVATVLAIVIKPKRFPECISAAIGGILVLVLGLVSVKQLWLILNETGGVLLLLVSLLLIAAAAEKAGFFTWCAFITVKAAKNSGRLLLLYVFILSALTTIFFTLDTTAVILTPVVYIMAVELHLDPPPFLYATIFMANTSSILLPFSNLTNLLFARYYSIGFNGYMEHLAGPGLVAMSANILLFFWLFRERIPERFNAKILSNPEKTIEDAGFFRLTRVILFLGLAGFLTASICSWPLYPVGLTCAGALWAAGLLKRRLKAPELISHVSWPLVPFVLGLALVVQGVENAGIIQQLGHLLERAAGFGMLPALLATVFGVGFSANLVNNIPAAMLFISALKTIPSVYRTNLLYASLLGCNLGPNLAVSGSLATMLWLVIVRRQGREISGRQFFRIGIITTPILLMLAALTLAATAFIH